MENQNEIDDAAVTDLIVELAELHQQVLSDLLKKQNALLFRQYRFYCENIGRLEPA